MTTTITTTRQAKASALLTYEAAVAAEQAAFQSIRDHGGAAHCPKQVFDLWSAAFEVRTAAFELWLSS